MSQADQIANKDLPRTLSDIATDHESVPAAPGVTIRYATTADVPSITQIYNHYVESSPATFDLVPFTVEQRMEWFEHYSRRGRHRLLVAESARPGSQILGYASLSQFRTKPAYDTTV